jgi:hypothetical protein
MPLNGGFQNVYSKPWRTSVALDLVTHKTLIFACVSLIQIEGCTAESLGAPLYVPSGDYIIPEAVRLGRFQIESSPRVREGVRCH